MNNLNKLIRKLQSYYWLGLCLCILQAEVVITEFFLNSAEGTQIPQYIELYNNSDTLVDVVDWSIETWLITDDCNKCQIEYGLDCGCLDEYKQSNAQSTKFNSSNLYATYAGLNDLLNNETLKIEPKGYFLISSNFIGGYNFYNGYNSDIEVDFIFYDAGLTNDFYGEIKGGKIILLDTNGIGIDTVSFNIDAGWPVGENSRGYSLKLHVAPDADENDDYNNWSLSPKTENSLFLYEGSQVLNYGSPQEENAFKLSNIRYSDEWFSNIEIDTNSTHIIYGDYNDFLKAEPFEDFGSDGLSDTGDEGEGNGIWNLGEEYHDRNLNNIWDYQDNNYDSPLTFSWDGTFIDTLVIQYEIIIEKNGIPIPNPLFDILDTEISILPFDLLIDSLGQEREIAEYTWTIELTKTYSDTVDIIYSDKYSFTIDASDYGRYGCVDEGSCTDDGNCPTNAYYKSSYISNHPTGCTPGDDILDAGCFSALNYYKDANINSNTCHYVSLSVPAYVTGDPDSVVTVPVYLYNDSLANIDSIAYTLSFDNSLGILSYENGTFSGTVISELGNVTSSIGGTDSISVDWALSEEEITFQGAGIITYLNFKLSDSPGEITDLLFSDVSIKGGAPENNIQVPVKDGEIVILQPDYEIKGNVVYYSGDDPYEVPNVKLTLNKMYDGVSADTSYIDSTNEFGLFNFKSLMEGNYSLSFSKEKENDCNEDSTHISGVDLYFIALHLTGSEPFNSNQEIAGDVSLDGTVSGLDASLIAQYIVGLNSNFNDVNIHWVFKPANLESLPSVHPELIYENGQYRIDYQPLVFDDKGRDINAYLLGDVYGNYCDSKDQSRYKNDNLQFNDIIVEYKPVISLPIILTESVHIQGMDIEIGYDKDIFEPLSITFNSLNQLNENYESLSNLSSHEGSIKTVIWATHEPQLISGIIGEVSFSWENNNEAGKIWLNKFIVNDAYAIGGLKLPDIDDDEIAEGLNIINKLYPEVLSLKQNYPNPFNPQTSIFWSMPGSGKASIEIYNLKGQFIDILFDGYKEPGSHEIIWNASAYPSGIYFYRLTIGETVLQKKMILLR